MNKEELLDFYTQDMVFLGTAPRTEIHQKGYWHKAMHVWIVEKRADSIYVLLQKRSPKKKNFPNLLDISAAGHFSTGETEYEAVREVEEELGINPQIADMHFIGIRKEAYTTSDGLLNNEFCYTYIYENKFPTSAFRLQTEEVEALFWVELTAFKQLFEQTKATATAYHFFSHEAHEITISNFVPPMPPTYYTDISQAISLFCAEE